MLQDAYWLMGPDSSACRKADDVFTLLKGSERIIHDYDYDHDSTAHAYVPRARDVRVCVDGWMCWCMHLIGYGTVRMSCRHTKTYVSSPCRFSACVCGGRFCTPQIRDSERDRDMGGEGVNQHQRHRCGRVVLCLRKYLRSIKRTGEFRAFVRAGTVVGACCAA